MSRYKVVSLNYITSGKNKTFINVDLSSHIDIKRSMRILQGIRSVVEGRKNILSEQKTGHEISSNFISKDAFGDILATSADIMVLSSNEQSQELSIGMSLSTETDLPNTSRMLADDIDYSISVEYDGTQIALENSPSALLLDENQPYKEDLNGIRTAFRIYTEKDFTKYEQQLQQYFNNRAMLKNKTFIIERTSKGKQDEGYVVNSRNNYQITPMYDVYDMCLKSRNKQLKSNVWCFDNLDKTEDIYTPQMTENPIQFCQSNGYTYLMHENSENDVAQLKSSLMTYRNTNYESFWFNMIIDDERKNKVSFYKSPYEIAENADNPDFSLRHVDNGRKFSIISKFNMADEYDFVDGNDYCDIVQTKSFYDENYTMDSTEFKNDSGECILSSDSCRKYIGIGQFNGNLYLKYNDSLSYYGKCSSKNVESNVSTTERKKVGYQKIETFLQNQQSIVKNHKSNFFSVRIHNTKFSNEEQYQDELSTISYQQLRKDITNAVRRIVENVSPVNTTLIDVQFQD